MAKPFSGQNTRAERRQQRHRLTVAFLGAVILLLGASVLNGWVWQIRELLTIVPSSSAMALTTATCFSIVGCGLIFSVQRGERSQMAAFLLFSLAAALSGTRLIELVFIGHHVQITEHFLASLIVEPHFAATIGGGMAPNTAIILFLASLSLALTPPDRNIKAPLVEELIGYVVMGLGLAALAGYAVGAEYIYRWGPNIGMAFQTAVGIVLLGSAMLVRSWWLQPQSHGDMPVWFPAAICMLGLLVDLYTPLGVASGVLYVPLVLTSLWFSSRTAPFSLAFACSILILLGFFAINRQGDGFVYEATNRAITITTLWLVAIFIYSFHRKSANLDAERIRFDSVTRNTPNAVITADTQGRISMFNPAAEAMFGYDVADVMGKNVRMLMAEPYRSEHDGYLSHHARTGEKKIIGTTRTVTGRRSNGEEFPLDLSVSTFTTGTTVTYVAILRDITERVAHEEQLKTMFGQLQAYTADLERSNADLDEFAYIASHDLKEPLRGMHNHSRFLLEDYEKVLDEDGVRRLNRIVRLSQRMEKLVNDLLYFSRIGRQQLAIKRTDVEAIVKDVVSTMELYLEERHAKVVVEGELPAVVCDALRITEVYRNLITNAVKYNDKPEPLVTIGHLDQLRDDNGLVTKDVYFVRDNGKGIAKEFYEDIFRIFKRLEKSQESDDGTGAGLTFVRKIIARHEGDIWLDSEIGQGTTFYFTLGHKRENQHAAA